jgi:hypothetical protein
VAGVAPFASTRYPAGVTANAKSRRRWFGAVCLLVAIGMLIAGETVLAGRLSGVTLIGYWLGCFVLAAVAAGVALIDAARVRAESRAEQRELLESTLRQVEREKASRSRLKP